MNKGRQRFRQHNKARRSCRHRRVCVSTTAYFPRVHVTLNLDQEVVSFFVLVSFLLHLKHPHPRCSRGEKKRWTEQLTAQTKAWENEEAEPCECVCIQGQDGEVDENIQGWVGGQEERAAPPHAGDGCATVGKKQRTSSHLFLLFPDVLGSLIGRVSKMH